MKNIVILASTLAVLGCSPTQPKTDPKADQDAVEKIRDTFTDAFNANDAAKVGSIYSENAVMMNNGQSTATGRAAITESNKMMFDQFKAKISLKPRSTKVSGDLAFDEGTYSMEMTPKSAGAKPITDEGRYLVVLQREAEGWKVIEDIGNVTKGAAPAPEAPKKTSAAKPPASKAKAKGK